MKWIIVLIVAVLLILFSVYRILIRDLLDVSFIDIYTKPIVIENSLDAESIRNNTQSEFKLTDE